MKREPSLRIREKSCFRVFSEQSDMVGGVLFAIIFFFTSLLFIQFGSEHLTRIISQIV